MAGILDYYGYKDAQTGLVSSRTQEEQKNKEQDLKIQKNYDDNIVQQDEIDRNSLINNAQETQISDLYERIENISGGTTAYIINANFEIQTDSGFTAYEISYQTTSNDKPLVPKTCTITKYINDDSGVVILSNTGTSSATTTSNITGNKEQYVLEVVPNLAGALNTKFELTRYLCYVGASSATTMTTEIVETFQKYVSDGDKFMAQENSSSGQYMWFIIPSYINLQYITSFGITFMLDTEVQTITNSLGTFKCYRSHKMLDTTSWPLMIYNTIP